MILSFTCPQGHQHEHLHLGHGGGRLRMVWDSTGKLVETTDTRTTPPPDEHPCPECGEPAKRVPVAPLFNLRADGTQASGWSHPGWCNVDYRNGPEGKPASHLKGLDGAQNPYNERLNKLKGLQ